MERELFARLTGVLERLPGAHRRPAKGTYTDRSVLAVAVWAAVHDRPISWATRRENWPWHDRGRALPTPATMSRRMRSPELQALVAALIGRLRVRGQGERTLIIDGRALTIAAHSGDRDAGFGRAAGGVRRGYKLHQIADLIGNCRAFVVEALNVSEQAAATRLIAGLEAGAGDRLLADANYDCNGLYERAGERGIQLIAQRRYKDAKGIGHHRHSVHRLRALALLEEEPPVVAARRRIEGCFGTQGNVIGGLGPLPNHVRGLARVRMWVAIKLAIDAAHRQLRRERSAA